MSRNRAVCVVAKGSVWGLRALFALVVALLIAASGYLLVDKLRRDWDWHQAWIVFLAIGMLAIVGLLLHCIYWLLRKWYEWAKGYAKDC